MYTDEPVVRRASRNAPLTEDDPRFYSKPQSSVIRYNRQQLIPVTPVQTYTRRKTTGVLLLGATAAVLLVILLSVLFSWWQGVMDNMHYGYPRTSQLDAVVGHNDSESNQTHFIFLNLHGHIEVIEIPGGDPAHARIFTGPTLVGAGQDLIPVTGEIRIENGRRDLIVHVQNQQIVYINDGSTFHQQ